MTTNNKPEKTVKPRVKKYKSFFAPGVFTELLRVQEEQRKPDELTDREESDRIAATFDEGY